MIPRLKLSDNCIDLTGSMDEISAKRASNWLAEVLATAYKSDNPSIIMDAAISDLDETTMRNLVFCYIKDFYYYAFGYSKGGF